MEPDTEHADRFLRMFLLHRYTKLIEKVNAVFSPPPEKLELLTKKVVHVDWIEEGVNQSKDEDDCE